MFQMQTFITESNYGDVALPTERGLMPGCGSIVSVVAVSTGVQYDRTLEFLRRAKEMHADIPTKSSIMIGLGETKEEIMWRSFFHSLFICTFNSRYTFINHGVYDRAQVPRFSTIIVCKNEPENGMVEIGRAHV